MQSHYNELTITTEPHLVEMVADFVSSLTDESVEFNKTEVILRSERDLTFVKEELVVLSEALKEVPLSYALVQKENQDWIENYKQSIAPIAVGRFYVHPSWHAPKEDAINLTIDPALAFGSGHHATTDTCLKAIDASVKAGMDVLDVGCGSGILALGAYKLGAKVSLCDTDSQCIVSSKENFELNSAIYEAIWQGSCADAQKEYNVVIANIVADVLVAITKELKSTCLHGGTLILSGILNTKEERVLEAYGDMTLKERLSKDEWVTLIYEKTNRM